jgi:DNA polymerase-4
LRKWGYRGRTISVKIRSSDFSTITRSHLLNRLTDRCDVIFQQALSLVPKEYGMKIKVRLLGVRVSQLQKVPADQEDNNSHSLVSNRSGQMELLSDSGEDQVDKLTKVVDAIRDKYGEHSITLAGTLRY